MVSTDTAPRVLVVGLDVGDGALVREWIRTGDLPHFAALAASGAWAELETPADTLHVSAWPSLYTGTRPGAHGVYYTFQPVPGQQGAKRFAADQYGRPPFWQLAAEAGLRATVFDAPYTHPATSPVSTGTRAAQVFEWGTWAHYWTPSSQPAELFEQLRQARGSYPLRYEANQIGLVALEPSGLARDLERAAAAKAEAAAWLFAARPAELFVTVLGETHPAAHYCWPAGLAVTDVRARPDAFAGLLQVYRAVDAALGRLLALADAETTVLVVSGDGVGPNRAGWHLLPEVLTRLGFLVPPGGGPNARDGESDAAPSPRKRRGLFQIVRDSIPNSLRQSVSRYLPAVLRDKLMAKKAADSVDWSRTRAYCLPTDFEGCLRINLKGREPEGIVAPGAEYDEVCRALTAELEQLVNPATGRRAVQRVVQVAAELPGERRGHLPDLVVLWATEAPITALRSAAVGEVTGASPDERTGTHDPRGFLLARGPGISPGELQGMHVVDFAPLVLQRLGAPLPAHLEGSVPAALSRAPRA